MALADGQGALMQAAGGTQVTLVKCDQGKTPECMGGIEVVWANETLADRQRALEPLLCFRVLRSAP